MTTPPADSSNEINVPQPIRDWLIRAVDEGASDLHLVVGHPATLRYYQKKRRITKYNSVWCRSDLLRW